MLVILYQQLLGLTVKGTSDDSLLRHPPHLRMFLLLEKGPFLAIV